jgi:hypothetical protein
MSGTVSWETVRRSVRCSFGHDAGAGDLVRFGASGAATCAECLRTRYGIEPPIEKVRSPRERSFARKTGEQVRDGKAESLGLDQ